jgi:hypothetical protein
MKTLHLGYEVARKSLSKGALGRCLTGPVKAFVDGLRLDRISSYLLKKGSGHVIKRLVGL